MADRFWVGDGGNWSDALNHWSASSGGAPNASLPTSVDSVYFDANSFSVGGQTVTVNVGASTLAMDWTGATNNPTLAGSAKWDFFGNITFITSMNLSWTGLWAGGGVGAKTIRMAGNTYKGEQLYLYGGSCTFLDDFSTVFLYTSIRADVPLNTGGFTVTVGHFVGSGDLTLGASIINVSGQWSWTGANINAGTSSIRLTGTASFAGNGKTYYDVQLNGTAHTISGSNAFNTLTLKADTTQTITFTAGTIQTTTTATLDGDATHAHTIKSGTAGTLASLIATTVTETYVTYTDMRLSWETLEVGEVLVYSRALSIIEGENIRLSTKWRYR